MLPGAALVLAVLVDVAAALAGFGTRLGLWHFRTGFDILKWAAYGGLVVALVALAGGVLALKARRPAGFVLCLVALAGGAVVFAMPLQWRMTAARVPPIHDITTDTVRPPQFVDILPLRRDAPNPSDYGGAAVAAKQLTAYSDIKTQIINASPEDTFAQALDAARSMGWRIVAAVPAEGRIEATDTTFWFGFTDDIVVRIEGAGYRSLVDVRSVSRVGRSDVGTNAGRIREFLRRLAVRG
jgi:uncharacterized protein (DUF1499 family)